MKVGLMLPMGEQEKSRRTLPWQELREMALAADEAGLDSVWAADHLIFRELGLQHAIVHLWPPNAAAVSELGRAAEIARADARIGAHG